jgi:hypothetical protein
MAFREDSPIVPLGHRNNTRVERSDFVSGKIGPKVTARMFFG